MTLHAGRETCFWITEIPYELNVQEVEGIVMFKLTSLKAKVKLSLCFNWAPRNEDVLGEWKYSSTHSLTLTLDGDEWSDSRPSRFTPTERTSGSNWIGGWVGSRAVLDAVVKRKIPNLHRGQNVHMSLSSTPIHNGCFAAKMKQENCFVTCWKGSPNACHLLL
jgi:hypothetical protein